MKWIKTIEDFKEHIFGNKERISERKSTSELIEKPREIYEKTCSKVAEKLSILGFEYFPSQHKLKLNDITGNYSLFVKFSSSRYNVAEKYIECKADFYINSKKLKQFSKRNPLINKTSETLIGGDIGHIVDPKKGKLILNLADKSDLKIATEVIPESISLNLIPLFEDFQNSEQVIKNNLLGFDFSPIIATQYFLAFDKRKMAEEYLSNYLNREPNKILEDYIKASDKFKTERLPTEFVDGYGYGYNIALLEIVYGLKITVPNNV
ncbi:MAG: hypothetical protein Aureis2KO_05010 [Aureisphaera sp.]